MGCAQLRHPTRVRGGMSAKVRALSAVTVSTQDALLLDVVDRVREIVHVVRLPDGGISAMVGDPQSLPVIGVLPPLYPEWLGDRSFTEAHGLRFPYVAGEMANGIATTEMVIALGRAGMLGMFGAAGLPPDRIASAITAIGAALPGPGAWGINLIHAPQAPGLEQAVADLLIAHRVGVVSVSAFMDLTPTVVQVAASGLRTGAGGEIVRARRLIAKVSRPEVAAKFMAPPPRAMLDGLVASGRLAPAEADLASRLPVVQDITVEADSGGHTDNRPLLALLPRMLDLAATAQAAHGHAVRCGAAGGLGTPQGIAGAFAAGAAYVLTGSVNQTCVEAGVSADAKAMLAQADIADVMMAAASDMFELGVKVQVLRRGTLFGQRANQLFAVYRDHASLDDVAPERRAHLERSVLGASIEDVWAQTCRYWADRDPAELARADADPKHRMALVFRWYLGRSSWWAIEGDVARRTDYQLWCGPATGAFNAWVRGSFLADPAGRDVVQVARNLLEGAAVVTRAQQLRSWGVPVPAAAFNFVPRRLE